MINSVYVLSVVLVHNDIYLFGPGYDGSWRSDQIFFFSLHGNQFNSSVYFNRMRFILWSFCFLLTIQWINAANPHGADIDDNDFAEFEDFDDEGKFLDTRALQTP